MALLCDLFVDQQQEITALDMQKVLVDASCIYRLLTKRKQGLHL